MTNIQQAEKWRSEHPKHRHGFVLILNGRVYGWKNELRNPESEIPGAIAVSNKGEEYIAKGGNDYDGARSWEPLGAEAS